jgi:hypothetical protein
MKSVDLRTMMPLVFVSASLAYAQPVASAVHPRQTPALAVPAIRTPSQALDFWITTAEAEIVTAAAAMPEERYSFAPTAGAFAGVRTFGQQVKHLAANNYRMAAYILGQAPTADETAEIGPDSVLSRGQIVEYIKGSFIALHRAVAGITERNMVEPLAAFPSRRQRTRLQLAVDAVAHSYDHYGQIVEYLRMNGIVPPASR